MLDEAFGLVLQPKNLLTEKNKRHCETIRFFVIL